MVVVFGNEKHHVDDAHRLLKPRMNRRAGNVALVPTVQAVRKALPCPTKLAQEILHAAAVVIRFVRLLVLEIGGPQKLRSRQVVIKAGRVQLVQVKQVADVLLNGPPVTIPPREDGGRKLSDLFLEARRKAPQALHQVGE